MFERGLIYKRGDVHLAYGGAKQLQQQGGILTPASWPFLVVITGERGKQHGYDDFWDTNGVLNYYGAGQSGDMQWRSPNTQLRDHVELGKDVHVFEEVDGGLQYRGQFVCAGYYEKEDVPDTNGNLRVGFVFELVPIEDIATSGERSTSTADDRRWTISLDQLRDRAGRTTGQQPRSAEAKRRTWERSEDVKVYVRRRADGVCEACGSAAPFVDRRGHPYLEPHHTRRLTDGGPDDIHHVIAVCPTCHRRVHHADDGVAYNERLAAKLLQLEPS